MVEEHRRTRRRGREGYAERHGHRSWANLGRATKSALQEPHRRPNYGKGTAFHVASVLKAAGITFGDLAKVDHSPFGNSARMVEQDELDATEVTAGLGVEAVRHLLATGGAKLVPIPPEVVAKIGDPLYRAATIPAGTFPGQPEDVPTVSIMNALVTRASNDDEAVYLITKSLFGHLDQLARTHPAAKEIVVAKAASGLPVPLHPGAERYYREIGLIK